MYSCASLGLFLFIFLLNISTSADDMPKPSELKTAKGMVSDLTYNKYSIKFKLTGYSPKFVYAKKGGKWGDVYYALSSQKEIDVRYQESLSKKPFSSKEAFYAVYEINIQNASIASYQDIYQASKSDDKIGHWMAWAFLAAGIFLFVCALGYKEKPNKSL